jgi:hypothetical protein
MRMEGGAESAADPIDHQRAEPNFQALIYPGPIRQDPAGQSH